MTYPISDWDDAYANAPYIRDGAAFPARWAERADAFRAKMIGAGRARLDVAYGPSPRNRLDFFYPEDRPKGLVLFVHGGYWRMFDKSTWSYLAEGSVSRGYVFAVPSYTLCPDIRIAGIAMEIAAAIDHAARESEGGIFLCGHSAGGHLVARMISANSPLSAAIVSRIASVAPISGLFDLRPLMATTMNGVLRIDEDEAARESPALLRPLVRQRIVCWVGANERPEFLRQSRLLQTMWSGFDARIASVEEPDKHHYDIIDGLTDGDHPLLRAVLGAAIPSRVRKGGRAALSK